MNLNNLKIGASVVVTAASRHDFLAMIDYKVFLYPAGRELAKSIITAFVKNMFEAKNEEQREEAIMLFRQRWTRTQWDTAEREMVATMYDKLAAQFGVSEFAEEQWS